MKSFYSKINLFKVFIMAGMFIFFQFQPMSGESVKDSLIKVLSKLQDDTLKVKTLNAISHECNFSGDYEQAKITATQALALSRKLNYPPGIYASYLNLGNVDYFQGHFDAAMINYDSSFKIANELSNKSYIGDIRNSYGIIYYMKGNPLKAMEEYSLATKAYAEVKNDKKFANVIVNMANIYYDNGNYAEAIEYFLSALKTFEKIDSKRGISACYYTMAAIFEATNETEKALKYNFLSLKLDEGLGDRSSVASCHNNIGLIYFDLKKYDKALAHFDTTLQIKKEIGEDLAVAQAQSSIANVYEKTGRHKEAEISYKNTLEIALKEGSKNTAAEAYLGLSNVAFAQANFTKAKEYANAGIELVKLSGKLSAVEDFYLQISKIDSALGNNKEAYLNYKLYHLYNDSEINTEKEERVSQLGLKYEFSKIEDSLKYNQALTTEKLKQQVLMTTKQRNAKNYLVVGVILLVIISFITYNNYRTKQKLRLQTLRNKIASDLHDDVGSTLSSISIFSQMAQSQSKETIPALEIIGESSRKMLDAMADIVWTINPENDQFDKIIMRMKSFAYELLGAKHVDFEFTTNDLTNVNLSMEARKNIYLIFKESTNNMVKYSNANKAVFAINKENDLLTMMIRDNGKGFDPALQSQGNGLKNMKKRAEDIGGRLIIDTIINNGTTIKLQIHV